MFFAIGPWWFVLIVFFLWLSANKYNYRTDCWTGRPIPPTSPAAWKFLIISLLVIVTACVVALSYHCPDLFYNTKEPTINNSQTDLTPEEHIARMEEVIQKRNRMEEVKQKWKMNLDRRK